MSLEIGRRPTADGTAADSTADRAGAQPAGPVAAQPPAVEAVIAKGGAGRGVAGGPYPPGPVRAPVSLTVGKYSALLLFALFIVIFGALKPHLFLTVSTFRLTFGEGVVTAVLALAFLVPLAAGIFDLSIGAMMGLSLVLINWFAANTDIPVGLVCLGAVLVCCLVGLVSGFLVVRLRVNSLIATLGVSQVLTAVGLKVSDNRQITGAFSDRFATLGSTNLLGVPVVVLYLLALAVILWFVLEHTPVGRYLFAVGSNPEAARLAGLPAERLVYGSLIASGGVAGIAGVIYAMRVGVYTADSGSGLLFPALAAVFFGASQFSRRPNVWGTLVAYFALAFGVKGLQLAFGPGTFWIQPLFQGVALLIAVALASRQVAQTRRSRRTQAAAAESESTSGSGSGAQPEPVATGEPRAPAP
ncbi:MULTISPECIES: ABC transporter permease [unclassified Frankia]|uniref:ABC transporter permease n=1 Tax=unclassified Frankia TaxID=2632575 RepID=UPI002AD3CF87|nr:MULTISPECIES: ABC transporter permease [unclassified Frankia]